MVGSDAWLESDGVPDQLGGTRGLALLQGDHAEQVKGIGIGGVAREESLVDLAGPVEVALGVKVEGRGKVVLHEATLYVFVQEGRKFRRTNHGFHG
jgi:hypothetical protein